MALFHAYIANQSVDQATFGLLAVFASRAVADEWSRAISASPHARFIERVAPQFYTHDATQCNLSGFFDIPHFKPIADVFRGRMQLIQLNDGLLGTTIMPQEVTDHISGGWDHIRSVSDHALCSYHDPAEHHIQASDEEPTQIRISIRNGGPEGTILAGEHRITLHIDTQLPAKLGPSEQSRCQEDLAKLKQQLLSSKATLAQERVDVRQKWQAAAAAERELADVQRQLDAMESSNEAIVEENADAKQKLQATERERERLAKLNQQFQSSKTTLVQERVDVRQKSQAAAAAVIERELADVEQQPEVMESSTIALVQDSADVEQKSQVAVAAIEKEFADVKQQLDVMESINAVLDTRVKSLMQEVAATEAPLKWLSDILLRDRRVTLHDIYKAVLLSVSDWKPGETTDTYRRILGIIAISQAPLTDVAIVDLLGLGQDSINAFRTALRRLGCVIQWSKGQPARTLYKSFPDYLTNHRACSSEPWFIDVHEQQRALTLACLRIMNEGLHFNMGDLKTSYMANAEVPDLSAHVEAVIPQSLSYSCRFWGHHLHQMSTGASIQGLVLRFFEVKFLYWLEVLSLSGEMAQASRVLVCVLRHIKNPSNKVYAFAQDGLKFVEAFALALACSTPHIYLSCIPLAPPASLVKLQYTRTLQNLLMVESGIDENWPALPTQVFEGHSGSVNSVAFSPDGQCIASGSSDNTIRIWDAKTGSLLAEPFEGHTDYVFSVAFSPDSQRVASGSRDKTIRVWDAQTGALIAGPFKGHTGYVHSVAFSPDSQRIASGSEDKTVRIWDAKTGSLIAGPFEGHTNCIFSVAFSLDSQRVASGSQDRTIRIWNAQTGALIAGPFEGHTDYVRSVVFSPDSQRIASGSEDKTIRVWDVKTGTLIASPFEGHTDYVFSVAFSPDSQRVASGSRDKTVRIWDAQTGTLIAGPFKGHTDYVHSVAFSPDSQRIALGSEDKTIRICDVKTGILLAGPSKGHTASVNATASAQQQHLDAHNGLGGHSQLENGWMVNSSGGLLFYVPYAHRAGLWWRHDTAVTSLDSICLDLTHFIHGEDWVRC
ncbi:WD40 repeat-like protein, partial [Athelia psychrophila]